MKQGVITKEVDGRLVFSIPVDRVKGFGTADCINYWYEGDEHPFRDLDTYCAGVDMELKSVINHCDKNLKHSEECYKSCVEFCMSASIPAIQLEKFGIPQTSRSYYVYFNPVYTSERMFATPVQDGYNKQEVQEASGFIVKNLKTLLT